VPHAVQQQRAAQPPGVLEADAPINPRGAGIIAVDLDLDAVEAAEEKFVFANQARSLRSMAAAQRAGSPMATNIEAVSARVISNRPPKPISAP